ncbi:hypothetical protein H257_13412 [Aphanomyces astaci]|uniref:Uncharacterized protein n=1 Tax=Aphanomyces astaci TaxID=112090 RepID=W4FWU8_APHAT|nr:hypothetical protein H257_13412 [Aphanomyces astaci]ETV71274.1 hypothetical protein H257_13412 [Aphanomyces astaci]|eukprot:XP_009839214.1 hypothetical protein H257_13412 [Aphanomyces astaci]
MDKSTTGWNGWLSRAFGRFRRFGRRYASRTGTRGSGLERVGLGAGTTGGGASQKALRKASTSCSTRYVCRSTSEAARSWALAPQATHVLTARGFVGSKSNDRLCFVHRYAHT